MNSKQTVVVDASLKRLWMKVRETCEFLGVEITREKSFIDLWREIIEKSHKETLEEMVKNFDYFKHDKSSFIRELHEITMKRLEYLNKEVAS